MTQDRKQVGLTVEASAQLAELKEHTPYFSEEADIYRLAVVVALTRGETVTEALRKSQFKTKFRTVFEEGDASDLLPRLDSADRKLARMIQLFDPASGQEPYRYSQFLATLGISFLHRELVGRRRTLVDVIQTLQSPKSTEGLVEDGTLQSGEGA